MRKKAKENATFLNILWKKAFARRKVMLPLNTRFLRTKFELQKDTCDSVRWKD